MTCDFDKEFAIFFKQNYKKIHQFVELHKRVPEDADDIIGDALLQISRSKHKYDPDKSSLKTWFMNTLRFSLKPKPRSLHWSYHMHVISIEGMTKTPEDEEGSSNPLDQIRQDLDSPEDILIAKQIWEGLVPYAKSKGVWDRSKYKREKVIEMGGACQ